LLADGGGLEGPVEGVTLDATDLLAFAVARTTAAMSQQGALGRGRSHPPADPPVRDGERGERQQRRLGVSRLPVTFPLQQTIASLVRRERCVASRATFEPHELLGRLDELWPRF
jgi:hypothetical protein